ncbi:Carbon starvation protein A [Polystyrenella longa]|uniref:Carbon starvation protein A n=1 Tax=Polystyrenella longa TaxID=2528007 RepID=A0A518CQM3_9PLAN|nr:carbon starvation protein A [Polystyrenella longa]QDU81510.1 Carbon starvation protein A [Polystyrenella longa]
MLTLLIAVGSLVGYLIAYHTYGRWLSRKIFGLDPAAEVPSHQLRDNIDFVPTKKNVIFGHHFTSIAGTGPIVGPAIAVFWGWLPALLWVLIGSIFVGAVHDFGSLVISLRNRGQTLGEIAGRIISPRARLLFLLVLFAALTVVLAVFGLVIAVIFKNYPQSVLSTWIVIPLAVVMGIWAYKYNGNLTIPSLISLVILYGAVYLGAYYWPITVESEFVNPIVFWTLILFVYCYLASVLPVWLLLQPRDFINSQQLVLALVLLVIGVMIAAVSGRADLANSAPMIATELPPGTPPIFPFLFITIACGACSGFHCLVSSGTTSKQVDKETDAQYVGYGAMLLEGGLAVLVILACSAGVGMGKLDFGPPSESLIQEATLSATVTGEAAWRAHYFNESVRTYSDFKLANMLGAFVEGGANFLYQVGIPLKFGVGLIAVLVACFAATTLDTATRLQRYVVQEIGETVGIRALNNRYVATGIAVGLAGAMAMLPAATGQPYGTGGLILWPLFGATNQLLAGLAFMVIVIYLWRRNKPIWFAAIPMVFMLLMPAYALLWNMFSSESGWFWPIKEMIDGTVVWEWSNKHLLFLIGLLALGLQIWMVIEGAIILLKTRGKLEDQLPPLPVSSVSSGGSD